MDEKVDCLSARITMNNSYSLLPLKISGIRVQSVPAVPTWCSVFSAGQAGDINTQSINTQPRLLWEEIRPGYIISAQ